MIDSPLGPRGLKVSRLSLGTAQFGMRYGLTKAKSQDEVDAIIEAASELGVILLDTAPAYGDSEDKVGDHLRRLPGHHFKLATKAAGLVPEDAKSVDRLFARLSGSLETSRAALGTLDVVQLHQTEPWLLQADALWTAVDLLRAEGWFHSFGVSAYEPEEALGVLERGGAQLDLLQVPFNVLDQRFRPVIQAAAERGVGILARSAFLKGTLTAQAAGLPAFLSALAPHRERLAGLAERVGLSAADVALAFVAGEPGVGSVLVGVDHPGELRGNAALMDRLDAIAPIREDLLTMAVSDRTLVDPRLWAAKGF